MRSFSKKRPSRQAYVDPGVSRFLHASAEQIQAATDETQDEVDGLARLVIALAEHVTGMSNHLDRLEQQSLRPEDMKAVRDDIASLDAVANKTIARLQFADRMNQRLFNVQSNLDALAELLTSSQSSITAKRWDRFVSDSRSNFTIEQERRLFDECLFGQPANDNENTMFSDNVTLFAQDGDDRDDG